ncbi:NEK3 [Branchiostoma lanceolatum]|uniref:NEK3 protein n=1 Tax=Branchiostoma lanceolatum TaxID=7740 RepID=A0A8K0AGP4_BRALA|nr:NEK3 [Branchiostoma lanceolatum]
MFTYVFGVSSERESVHFLVSEFVSCRPGEASSMTLQDALDRPTELLMKDYEYINVLHEVATGVHYLHAQHILHNDIKTDNVLVYRTADPRAKARAKLIDLGNACWESRPACFDVDSSRSSHIAPEVAVGGPVSSYSDIYSFGYLAGNVDDHPGQVVAERPCVKAIADGCVKQARPTDRMTLGAIIRLLADAEAKPPA